MNTRYSYLSGFTSVVGFVALLASPIQAKPVARLDARLQMMVQLQTQSPCITSLIGPATASCIPWQANVEAVATFEPSRRLIIAGAADSFLHVIDADNARRIAQVATEGRVVTEALLDKELSVMYIGTDKGWIHALDAYSFKRIFSVQADSAISNDLMLVQQSLVFTTALGTLYALEQRNGAVRFRVPTPDQDREKIRLARQTNLVVFERGKENNELAVVVPHASGMVSMVNFESGNVLQSIKLSPGQEKGFSDIVAPMIWFKNRLWIASYDGGIFGLDTASGRVIDVIPIKEVVQLASDGTTLFAASTDVIYAISESLKVAWMNPIADKKSRPSPAGYPFNQYHGGLKRMFYGMPSRLLLGSNHIIFATSAGSLGLLNKATGVLEKLVGNGVGYGSSIGWAGATDLVAISKRGLLMKFQIFDSVRSGR